MAYSHTLEYAHSSFGTATELSYSQTILATSGLVAYYRSNETAGAGTVVDHSSNANSATNTSITLGSTALLATPDGTSGLYNGTASKAVASDLAAMDFAHTDSFTIEAVIRLDNAADGSGTARTIISKMMTGAPFTGWELVVQRTSVASQSVLRFNLYNNFGGNNKSECTFTIPMTAGTNYHVAATWTPDTYNPMSVFVNGLRQYLYGTGGGGALTASLANSEPITIAARQTSRFWKGNMSDIAVYNRVLTDTEIRSHAAFVNTSVSESGLGVTGLAGYVGVPNVIMDMDITGDYDDFGDLQLACYLHIQGVINLVGVVTSSSDDASAPVVYSILDYFGLEATVPVGAYKGTATNGTGAGTVAKNSRDFFRPGDSRTNYDDDYVAYRTMLAGIPDGTGIVVFTGYAIAFKALLESAADGISALSGSDLVAAKVNRIVPCAGTWPSSTGFEANIAADEASWSYVAANCPVPIVWCGVEMGFSVVTGPPAGSITVSPPARAYSGGTNSAWAQLALLYAAYGLSTRFFFGERGDSSIHNTTGARTWTANPSGDHYYLRKRATDAAFVTEINTALSYVPP